MRIAIVLGSWLLMGMSCVTIEQMSVHTVAVDCDVARGAHVDARGAGQADTVQRSGDVAGALVRNLASTVTCRGDDDGTTD